MSQVAEERAHALLGASSAKIWLTCTPSARFSEAYEDKGSEFANEGTAAHELAALMLQAELGGDDEAAIYAVSVFCQANQYYDGEMREAISAYVDYVMERYHAAQAICQDAQLLIEQRVDFSAWVPEGFGTADVVIIADGTMEVIDLKYGKGVLVVAGDNPQIRLYGAGALAEHGTLYDLDTLLLTIYQPRKDNVSTECIAVDELQTWLDDYVEPRAKLAWDGSGDYCPGEACQFCKGKTRCRALAEYHTALARHEFRNANELSPEEIAEVMIVGEKLSAWVGSLQEFALQQAHEAGVVFPGWKLVEGRSNRKYADPDAVVEKLKAEGFEEAILYERKLLGLTAMEKVVGKKMGTLLGELIIKPPGAPALVQESDKRAAIGSAESAAADFGEELLV